MSSPSALLKVNYLVMRCLHFVIVLGDLQEGHVYGKRPRGYTFQCHSPSARAQKWRFCARGWLPRTQQRCHEPCGVHLAAVRQATDCRNLPRNLPPCMLPGTAPVQPTAVALPPARLPLGHPTCCSYYRAYRRGATAEALPQKTTVVCYRRGTTPGQPTRLAYYRAMGPAPSGRVIRM